MPVLLTADFPPAHGGIQRFMAGLAKALCDRGTPLVVVAPGLPGMAGDEERRYPVIRFGVDGKWRRPIRMLQALRRAHRLVGDRTTICSTWAPAGLAATLFHAGNAGRLVVFAMGQEVAPHASPLRRALQRAVFKRADHRIAISRFTAAQLTRAGVDGAVSVVPCGVDPWSVIRAPAREPTILSVGRLIRRKGFDRVIAALPELRRRLADVRYEIVGNGPQRAELEALAAQLGVLEHVSFLGAIDDEELRAAYARAWCFALPTRAEGDDVEGFGIVYLEAGLAGLPCVGGSESGAADAIVDGSTGLLVDGNDLAGITGALARILAERDWAASLGYAARERALREFTWERVAERIAAVTGLDADEFGDGAPRRAHVGQPAGFTSERHR